ncbi:MAG: hypothetical protein U0939_08630 [Pirellulales bacterium]
MKNASSTPRPSLWASLLQVVTFPLRGAVATFSAFLILLVIFAGGFGYAWQRWGGLVRNHPRYVVGPDQLVVTPRPEWVKADVESEVLRDGGLSSLTLLDPQVTVKVARAFSLHCWVSEVRRVRKEYPSRLVVELEYRKPVAMVEVTTNGQRGLLPVDGKGVLLPPQDFSADQTADYVRIAVGETLPAGSPGTAWGDPEVAGAAAIAAALGNTWRAASVYRIASLPAPETSRGRMVEPQFALLTRDGVQIVWGHAPGHEAGAEARAADKVARLGKLVEQTGGRLPTTGTKSLDLRDPGGITTGGPAAAPVSTGGAGSVFAPSGETLESDVPTGGEHP